MLLPQYSADSSTAAFVMKCASRSPRAACGRGFRNCSARPVCYRRSAVWGRRDRSSPSCALATELARRSRDCTRTAALAAAASVQVSYTRLDRALRAIWPPRGTHHAREWRCCRATPAVIWVRSPSGSLRARCGPARNSPSSRAQPRAFPRLTGDIRPRPRTARSRSSARGLSIVRKHDYADGSNVLRSPAALGSLLGLFLAEHRNFDPPVP